MNEAIGFLYSFYSHNDMDKCNPTKMKMQLFQNIFNSMMFMMFMLIIIYYQINIPANLVKSIGKAKIWKKID